MPAIIIGLIILGLFAKYWIIILPIIIFLIVIFYIVNERQEQKINQIYGQIKPIDHTGSNTHNSHLLNNYDACNINYDDVYRSYYEKYPKNTNPSPTDNYKQANYNAPLYIYNGRNSFDYKTLFWGGWSREIHYIKQQRDISEKMFDINPDFAEVDEYTETAKIGKFDVSLSSCNCKSFQKRRLPCKHIYYLAWELGLPFPANPSNNTRIDFDEFDLWIGTNKNSLNLKRSYNDFGEFEISDEYWGDWSPAIHKLPSQRERQNRQSQNPKYQTSIYSCNCPDFVKRRLPCKHIYAVASQESLPI